MNQKSSSLSYANYMTPARILSPTSFRSAASPSSLPGNLLSPTQFKPQFMHKNFSSAVNTLYMHDPQASLKLPTTKLSKKKFGSVKTYAVNSHSGPIKAYNEDRVSITLKLKPPEHRENEQWPTCSYFGLFDGHAGKTCAGFLRDSLHTFILNEPAFPSQPHTALFRAFAAAEKAFIETGDPSGSCGIVVLIVGDQCFVANTGHSRVLISARRGRKIYALSRDHRPEDEEERERIERAGGHIFYTGRGYRVNPGRLPVTRCFGAPFAKARECGGAPGIILAVPEIKSIRLTKEHDFILLASDGVFEKMSNNEVVGCVRQSMRESIADLGHAAVLGVEQILINCFRRQSADNVTVLLIALQGIKEEVKAGLDLRRMHYGQNKQVLFSIDGLGFR